MRNLAWILVAVMLAGCDLPGRPNPEDRPTLPSSDLQFASLYAQNCAGCHGADGTLGPAPPLNDRLFLTIIPEAELLRVIEQGRVQTPMPGFSQRYGGSLTEEQVRALAAGLRTAWLTNAHEASPPPAYATDSAGDVGRGAEIFARACADCHAPGEPSALDDPAFLALMSDQALRRIIITGRPDLGMPDYADGEGRSDGFRPLTSAEIDDLVALLASWRTRGGVARREDTR